MEKKIILQKFKKPMADIYKAAELYYNVLSSINDLKLTSREIQLIAFTAIKGNISYANIRQEFCEKYDSSSATINNMISKLKKIGVFVKDGTKVKVNPAIVLNFDSNVVLQIAISHG